MRGIWKRRGRCVLPIILAGALFCPALPVFAEQTKEEKKLEELEKELQEIKASVAAGKSEEGRIEALEKEIEELKAALNRGAGDGRPIGLTGQQRDEVHDKTAAADHVNYNAEWSLGVPKRYVPDTHWIPISGVNAEMRLSGWINVALLHDFDEYLNPDEQEFSAGLVAVPNSGVSSTGMDARSSRFFLESRHLLENGVAIKNIFVIDGGGGGDTAGGYSARIRQANVTINGLTFGQAVGTFANAHAWPMYFDRGAPGAFPLARKPVIRYAMPLGKQSKSSHIFSIAVEEPTSSIQNADSGSSWPDAVARFDWNPKWGNLTGAVIARDLIARDPMGPGSDEAWVWGAQVSGVFTFRKKLKDHLKFNLVYGPGTSGIMWDTFFEPNDGVYVASTQTLETLDAMGAWVGWDHFWSKRLWSMFMLSYVDIDNIPIQAPSSFNTTITGVATLAWNFWERTYMALECFYGERENFDGQTADDVRINLVFRHTFNR